MIDIAYHYIIEMAYGFILTIWPMYVFIIPGLYPRLNYWIGPLDCRLWAFWMAFYMY